MSLDRVLADNAISREECEARILSGQSLEKDELDALAALSRCRRDENYWFPDGQVIEVEERTIKVHLSLTFGEIPALRHFIESEEKKLPLHATHPKLGSEAYPLRLQGGDQIGYRHIVQWLKYTYQKYNLGSSPVKCYLIAVISTFRKAEFTEEELTYLLKWGVFWTVDHAVKFAKDRLFATTATKAPSIRLGLAREFHLGDWIEFALEPFIDISITPQLKDITDDDINRMGYRVFQVITLTREANIRRRVELANVAPSMGLSEEGIRNIGCSPSQHENCRQAWREGWQTEVAARLLDPKNPISLQLVSCFVHGQIEIQGPRQTPSAFSRINNACGLAAVDNLVYGPELKDYGWKDMKLKAVQRVKKLYECWDGNDQMIEASNVDDYFGGVVEYRYL
ncbi:hypothetical protein V5O48_008390 [Marasmius crinis-equi]|uniref:Uncharacterized protein n=1 Tax=Marasmius crinis-equi TaxID=585013 RepID=A0ABR3FE25_9AGAR